VSSPRVYWRGRIHPLGRIGGYKRLKSAPLYFAGRHTKYRLHRATLGGPPAPTTTAQRTADQPRSRSAARDATTWSGQIQTTKSGPLLSCKRNSTGDRIEQSSFTRSTGKRRASHFRWPSKLPGTRQVKRPHRLEKIVWLFKTTIARIELV